MRVNLLAISVMACGAITVLIAFHAWLHRSTNGARAFALFMAAVAIYVLGYSLELASQDLGRMLFWSKIEYIGTLSFPTIYMVFTAQFSGTSKWLTRRNMSFLFIIPVIFLLIKFADGQIHLIYAATNVQTGNPVSILSFTRGQLYLVVTAYNLIIVTAGNYLLIRKWRAGSTLYRRQTSVILSAALVSYFVYGIYLIGYSPFPSLKNIDINPFIYSLWGIAIGFAIFKYRLFDLAPFARETLIEMLSDGVVVVDAHGRILDANLEASRIFGWQHAPVGQSAEKAMNEWICQPSLGAIKGSSKTEVQTSRDGSTVYYELTISPLKDQIGYLIVIHDISGLKNAEKEMEELSLGDELTRLYNRRGFNILANQMLKMAQRVKLNVMLIYIDLDDLKGINDFFGHAAGDQALLDTGRILKNSFRSTDIIARVGGDEFVAMAIESPEYPSEMMQNRLVEQVQIHNTWYGLDYGLSFSIGLARYEWQNPCSLEMLVEAADQAMYVGKRHKNRSQSRILKAAPNMVELESDSGSH